ncbi:glycoside hydrolase family 3 C-terminal domain-containing protein [Pelagicoccus sp. NFK12]|uniref:Glycoside hydrolase family 3 C-terminal domain-containing protein n=1 Tax=Pelagicoccus enzymogenes TaxID=2773457 RepID=A0A927F6E6_9BACT|nr:glycoside hydrolase family 3 C-terminal domain-containing protein [Pelagicoccus enzymogenes]MBD5778086.1 glycoside hydrolase family 3 C-terminal domain-containing protein [Pelagicoccus enzymogenes]
MHQGSRDAGTLTNESSDWKFKDPEVPLEERLEALMGLLTLEEKLGQMLHSNPAINRLGIPAYNWWNEACHGVGRAGRATVFPQVIGMAATWNRGLLRRVAEATALEARAKHFDAARRGWRGQYRGLTFWTPNINIFRDPRWGRGQETFGEDPYLTASLASEMVKGLQGEEKERLRTAACAKHFAVHSGPESKRHEFDARPEAKDLWETYLPAFEALVGVGVESVMGAYNRTLGEACCASSFLMEEVLRGRWGFDGHYVSDCGAIDDFHLYHGVTKAPAESAALAIGKGCDLNCGSTYGSALDAVERGLLSEHEVDRSVRRLLRTKLKLGLLDAVPRDVPPLEVVESPEHRALARRAASESIVLLKNENDALPLSRSPERALVVGPTAASIGALLGNYHGISGSLSTIVEGILEALPPNTAVKYRPGCPLLSEQSPGVNYTFEAANNSDYVIAVMGLDHTLEGEEGDTVASASGGDRDTIELPAVQREFLRQLRPYCRKLVLVLTGGGAIAAPEAHDLADAVLLCWYPGCEGGRAVADVLFGDVAPSGRLPVSVPRCTEDLPPFEDYSMRGRTYKFATAEPLYPFGFGLGYGKVEYVSVNADRTHLGRSDLLRLVVTVRNSSERPSLETVQCYMVPPQDWPDAPRAQLLAFEKIEVLEGRSKEIRFDLSAEQFGLFDAEGEKQFVPGEYRIHIGSSSPGARSLELGAAVPATVSVTLKP